MCYFPRLITIGHYGISVPDVSALIIEARGPLVFPSGFARVADG
jgi:hypothetical protein